MLLEPGNGRGPGLAQRRSEVTAYPAWNAKTFGYHVWLPGQKLPKAGRGGRVDAKVPGSDQSRVVWLRLRLTPKEVQFAGSTNGKTWTGEWSHPPGEELASATAKLRLGKNPFGQDGEPRQRRQLHLFRRPGGRQRSRIEENFHGLSKLRVAACSPVVGDRVPGRPGHLGSRQRPGDPQDTHPPTIDGTLSPGEWDRAAAVTGFQSIYGWMTERQPVMYVTYDNQKLYVAMHSIVPEGRKTAPVARRSRLPNKSPATTPSSCTSPRTTPSKSDLDYHFLANSLGMILDFKCRPSIGNTC